MPHRHTWLTGKALAVTLGLAGGPAAAQVPAQEAIGMKLEAVGFTMKRADTARKMERLRTLPKHKFVARSKNGVPFYIYADPDYCQCALIGDQRAMNSYRDMVAPPSLPPGVAAPGGDPDVPASGVNVAAEMEYDMNPDSESLMADDIFHPGF
jgi:hypothetical protein